MSNPFKIIQPSEAPPESVKKELMGSIDSIVLILRFVQLFVADSTAVAMKNFKIDLDPNSDSTNDNPTDQ
ncbi:MAG: hypothetical protein HKN45_00085 [Flavobacteriales bacterium]|nr:hypothetical protein [Flavobacteriales bacterium]